MDANLLNPLTIVRNKLVPKALHEATFNLTNWKLHSNAKRFFNLYELLEPIGRLDILEVHFDRNQPETINCQQFQVINGRQLGQGSWPKRTKLDEEIGFLLQDPNIAARWEDLKSKKITWNKQKIFEFHEVKNFEYTPS